MRAPCPFRDIQWQRRALFTASIACRSSTGAVLWDFSRLISRAREVACPIRPRYSPCFHRIWESVGGHHPAGSPETRSHCPMSIDHRDSNGIPQGGREPSKARRHGVSFEAPARAFEDDFSATFSDPDHSRDEARLITYRQGIDGDIVFPQCERPRSNSAARCHPIRFDSVDDKCCALCVIEVEACHVR